MGELERYDFPLFIKASEESCERQIRVIRVRAKLDILYALDRPLRSSERIDEMAAFDSVFHRTSITVAYDCDSILFRDIMCNIWNQDSIKRDTFTVPRRQMENAPDGKLIACEEVRVIFRTAISFFEMLGMPFVSEKQTLWAKSLENENMQMLRILGGCQWNAKDNGSSLLIYPGSSCSREKSDVLNRRPRERLHEILCLGMLRMRGLTELLRMELD